MTTLARAASINDALLLVDQAVSYAEPFFASIEDERVLVLSGSSSLFWTVRRGEDLTAASAHPQGISVTPLPSAAGADASGIAQVTKDLNAAQIATLNSAPVQLLPASGAGKAIVPLAVVAQYKPGTQPFANNRPVEIGPAGSPTNVIQTAGVPWNGLVAAIRSGSSGIGDPIANTALNIGNTDNVDPAYTGSILTHSLSIGGAGYAPGNTFTVDAAVAGGVLATGVVDTVDGGGAIVTYHLTGLGTFYPRGNAPNLTATSGIGAGGAINILTITPLSDGTARVTVWYAVVALA